MTIQIPDEAKKAATLALQKAWIDCASAEDAASAALAAGLAAWPDMHHEVIRGRSSYGTNINLILPLKETGE